jgi:tRNA modification GTPase
MEGIMAAMSQLRGDLSTNLNELERNLHSLVSLLEAQLEFPEEDIPDTEVIPMIEELVVDVEKLEVAFRRGRTQRRGLAVVILGRPNVGKSTLFNALLGQDRSIVTPVPGTTRDLVTEILSFPGGQIKLFDAAGIGIAESLPDQMAVRRAIGAANRADFLIVILDASTGPVPADEELLKLMRTKPGMVVWNKIDTVKKIPELQGIAGEPVCISALEGTNIESLTERLQQEASQHGKTFFANRFQEERLKQVISKLRSARDAAYMDMRAKDLREALELVSAADHPAVTAEILDNIFSRFCVGK